MKYNKINAEETEVIENDIVIGSMKREAAPHTIPVPWIYRFWPKGARSVTQAGPAFTQIEQLRKKLESK